MQVETTLGHDRVTVDFIELRTQTTLEKAVIATWGEFKSLFDGALKDIRSVLGDDLEKKGFDRDPGKTDGRFVFLLDEIPSRIVQVVCNLWFELTKQYLNDSEKVLLFPKSSPKGTNQKVPGYPGRHPLVLRNTMPKILAPTPKILYKRLI